MKSHLTAAIVSAMLIAGTASAQPSTAEVQSAALKDDVAWDIVSGLTTEVGQRLSGTEAEARARSWAIAKLQALGFSNVRIEEFDVEAWERGVERAEVESPFQQSLTIAALGYSGATPAKGISAEIIAFSSLEALKAAPEAAVKGKIVFLSHHMQVTQDGSAYRAFGPMRFDGPGIAAKKGAAGILVRSIGTDHNRLPHTGATDWEAKQKPIPAAALSAPDADQLERMLASNKPVSIHLTLTPRPLGKQRSGNVIAEIPGRDPDAGVIVIGGHLDSWDLGTGAIDDGAGVAITAAAALVATRDNPPLRTIRVVWFGSEENSGGGGDDYLRRHGSEKHVLAAESDFGADRVWRFDTRMADPASPIITTLAESFAPLGIVQGGNTAHGGADVAALGEKGVPLVDLRQDGTRYFDIHHTANDTLDKIDPAQLRQNVAAWATLLAIASHAPNWPEKGVSKSPDPQK